jgi:hypothetical protein
MNFNSEYIIETVKEIENDRKTLGKNDLENKYSVFLKKYPKIWMAIKDGEFDINMFKSMVSVHNKTFEQSSGDIIEKRTKSDICVGDFIAKKFVYGKNGVEEPSNQAKKDAYNKIMKKLKDDREKNRDENEEIDLTNFKPMM